MIYFFSLPEAFIVAVSMISVLCVVLQSISVVFSLNRHHRGLIRSLETTLEGSVLLQVLVHSLLIAQVSGGIRDSLILPSGYFILRYVLFGMISLLAASISIHKKSCLPSILILIGLFTLPYTEGMLGRIFPHIYIACLAYYIVHSLHVCTVRRREIKTSISDLSIKEAIDALQTGVLFCGSDGRIILINKKMQSLMILLTGTIWRNGIEYYSYITGGKLLVENAKAQLDGRMVFRLRDRSVWMFHDALLKIRTKSYHQMTATNVTEKWDATALLKEQNMALDARRCELTKTIASLQTIYQKEEALKAKSRIHDVLGQQIALLIRNLHEGSKLDQALLRAFAKDKLMNFAAHDAKDSAESDLLSLIEMMNGIGVKISIIGSLPDDIALATLFTEIITEGVTNAIRHGLSKEIDIMCKNENTKWVLTISNSGSPPRRPITEGNGIAGIKRKLMAFGGTLFIETSPRFALKAVFPKEG